MNDEYVWIWKEAITAYLKVLPSIYLKKWRKST